MKSNHLLRNFALTALAVFVSLATVTHAATLYWDVDGATAGAGGATPTGSWTTAGSTWSTDSTGTTATSAVTTTSIDDLFFSAGTDATGAYTVDLNASTQSARLITFDDGTVTLNNGTLSLGNLGGITVTSNTVTGATISSNLTLSGIQTFNVAAGRTLTLDTGDTFTRNAGSTLNILSTGTVTTTMMNLDSASLVNGIIGPWASYGTGASTRYATIDGSNNIVGLTGIAAATAANVTSTLGTFNYDVAAVGTLGASANVNTLRYTGAAGTIAGALTTNGIMNVGGGALVFSGAMTSGTGEMVINAANGGLTFSGGLNNSGNLLTITGSSNVAFGNTTNFISGAGGITMNGTGILTLNAGGTVAPHTYSGPTTINSGILLYNGGNNIGSGTGNITLNGGVLMTYFGGSLTRALGSGTSQLQILGGASGFGSQGNSASTFNLGATVQWGSAFFNPSIFVLQTTGTNLNGQLTFSSGIDLNGGERTISVSGIDLTGTSIISGVISNSTGTGSLIKIGSGPLTLSNTNTYNGSTTITAGTLIANSTGALGNSSATNTLIFNGGTLRAGGIITSASTRGVTMTATGIIDNNGQAISIAGNIGGAGGLTKNGTGTLTLSGTNSYGGVTTVNVGTLAITKEVSLASNTAANLNIKSGATLQLNVDSAGTAGFTSANLGTLFGNILVANTAAEGLQAGATLSIDTSTATGATFTQTSAITNSTGAFGGTIHLTKLGAGTLVFDQANTYTGVTTISAGTIQLNSGGSIAGSIINNSIYLVNQNATAGTAPLSDIAGTGSIAAGPSATITINTATGLSFNALNTTGGGFFALSGVTTPTLGGLVGTTGNLSSSFSSGYSGVTSLTLNTAANNIAGNSFTYGGVIDDGAVGMSLTKVGAGTQTLTGTNTYTGTTFLNGGTLTLGSGTGKISGTTAITFNGGTLQFNRSGTTDIDAINNAAAITVNSSSTFGVTTADAGNANANETLGAVTLNAGQMNFNWTNGGSSGNQMILTSLSRSGTASANFNSGFASNTSRWKVNGAGTTTAGQIIGPWYTTGGNNAGFASTDYAVYASDFVAQAAIAGSAETTWTNAANAYTTSAGGTVTLSATRTITALRNTGATTVLTLASGANLETFGLLNGVGTLLTVAPGTGGVLTTQSGGGNLYINAGAGAITISAPINNNGGNVTLVKNGSNTLTLTSTTSNFSGGVVLNAGTLSIDSALNIGGTNNSGGSTVPITVNGNSTISMPSNNLTANFGTGLITIANGATLTVTGSSRSNLIFGGAVTGDGGVTATSGSFWSKYAFNSTSNDFKGAITDSRSGNDGIANALLSFNSIADGAGYGNIILNGATDSGIDYGSGAIAALNLNNRQIVLANNNTVFFNNASSQAVNINTDIGFSGTGARQIRFGITGRSGAGISTFAGKLTDNVGGALTPTFNGGTWLVTNANNSYTGVTTVSGGASLGFGNGSLGSIGAINASGGTLMWITGNTQDISSRIAMTAATTSTFNTNSNNVTFATAFGGATTGALIKTGLGSLTFAGANTYTGLTTVSLGTLSLGITNGINSGNAVTVNSNTAGATATLDLNGFGQTIGGAGLTLGGATTTSASQVIGTGAGSILRLTGGATALTYSATNNPLGATISTTTLDLNGATQTFTVGDSSSVSDDLTVSSLIQNGAVTLAGAGRVTFSGNNSTYTGVTNITTWLNVSKLADGGLASSIGQSSNAASNLLLASGSRIRYIGSGDSTNRNFTINGTAAGHSATLDASGTGAINFTSTATPGYGTNNQTRTLGLSGSNTDANTLAATLTNNGSGALSINKLSPGRWILTGTNSYTGTTVVNAGTLQFARQVSLYNNTPASWTAANINVKSGATFAVNVDSAGTNGFTATSLNTLLTNISVAGSATAGLQAGATLGFDTSTATSGTFTQGNLIANSTGVSGGAIGLTKLGTGTLILDKTNTYTGATTVSVGTLLVNGSISTSSLTTVASGAIIGGSGTIGALTVSSGGFINPGNSPGILSTGNYVQAGTYNAEINGLTPGTQHDQINVTGTVDITGGSLVAAFSGTGYAANDLIFILLNDSTDAITGTYSGYANGATVATHDGFSWNISYFANNTGVGTGTFTGGNDIALQAVLIPEPKAALLGCIGLLLLLRRRR